MSILQFDETLFVIEGPDKIKLKCTVWISGITMKQSFEISVYAFSVALFIIAIPSMLLADEPIRKKSAPPEIHSSWDDLVVGIKTKEDWNKRRPILKKRYLKLLRDEYKPDRPLLDLQIHEEKIVDGIYTRKLISYQVEKDERAHAYLGIPLNVKGKLPAIVALHGTYPNGKERIAGFEDNPDKAYLDHLCRRGYVVIAPDHFVAGHRIPKKGSYDTTAFHEKYPDWTSVGKFTFEHSIAIDVLETISEVDKNNIGAMGHSLGGHGTIFLAAYDDRIKASASNCGASFFRHNTNPEHWSRNHWYVYFKHLRPGLDKGELPDIDFHEIIALIAPRAFLDVSATNDGNPLTQRQRALMLLRVMDIYEVVGKPDNFAFFIHGKKHSISHESRELIYGWFDSRLKPLEVTKTHLIKK